MSGLVGRAAGAAGMLYTLTFGLAMGESAILFDLVVPGETGMVLVGAAGHRAQLSLPLLIVCASVGVVVGDSIGFAIGRRWGTELADRWAFTRRHIGPKLERAEQHLEHHGGRSVFVARWIGALRAVVPVVAGTSRMRYRSFLAWSALSSILWTTVMVSAGWLLGDTIANTVDRLGWAISLVALAALAFWWWRRRRRSHSGSESATEASDPVSARVSGGQ